jgi:alanine-glyoxylate transaminase/serine-glyoxylate transaminase/serine-pyruvate transaminase
MGRRHGATVVRCEKPWGETYSEADVAAFFAAHKPAVVAFVHAETSTGCHTNPQVIASGARKAGALVIADCVTSLGGMPVNLDEAGVDVAYSGTQKALGCPPGLAPITVGPRGVDYLRQRKSTPATWYLDLKLLLDYYESAHRYHHTAPISMFYALREALAIIEEEGLENRYKRHQANHARFVSGLAKLGIEMLVAPADQLWTLNTPRVPTGVNDLDVRKKLMAEHGIEIAGGLGPLAGKVFRIGTMGYGSTAGNVDLLLSALQSVL